MAAIDKAFGAIPVYRMEYHQPDSFLQRTNQSAIVNSPYLDSSGHQLNQINHIPIASGLNNNGASFSMSSSPSLPNLASGGGSMGMFLGNVLPMQNPERSQGITRSGPNSRMRKKHKQDQEGFDCPLKRRKLCVSPVEGCQAPTTYTEDVLQPCWSPSQSQVTPADAVPPLCMPSSEMQAVLTEDMEETTIESQSDAAFRRIQDIESRLVIEEDDDNVEENKSNRLPTLVMSDVLVQSLKKGLDESLTRKIVDSMNRPSMELVLWKPQPEFLIDKLQSFSSSHKDETEAAKQDTPAIPFLRQIHPLEADKPQTLSLDCDIDPMWAREEEEMEL